jgi:hypothetical protein
MRTHLLGSLLIAGALAVPASATAAAPIAHPRGATDVVIRASSGGGFVAPRAVLGALPSFTLYGDGTVLVPGAVTQIFPGPAIAPVVRSHLSEAQLQTLLRRAKAAGLLAPRAIDYGDMGSVGISDAPTTTLRVQAAGRRLWRRAYALGVTGRSDRLRPAQAAARRALASFIDALPQGLAGSRYVPRALAVFVTPYNGQSKPGANTRTWPLPVKLAGKAPANGGGYRCIAIRGTQARTLLTTLKRANQETRWVMAGQPGTAYSAIARPMLPDERGCGSLAFG